MNYFNILSLLIFFTSIHLTEAQVKPELVLPIGHMSDVESIKFTPDSNYILTSSLDGKAKLWHIITGKLIRTFNHSDYLIDKVVIEPNHNFLLTLGGGPVKIWNIKTGSLINTIGEKPTAACFTPNGDKLVVAHSQHLISVFNYKNDSFEFSSYLIENQKEIEKFRVISTIDFNLDGTKLFVGSGGNIFKPWNYEIFDFYSKNSLKKIKGNSIDFYPLKQKFFVSHDSGVTVYDIKSLQKINVLPSKKPKVELVKLDLIKNELLVVSNINQYPNHSQNLALEKWDLNNFKLINESSISNPHDSSAITSIDLDKSNNRILISTYWGNTNLYEISTGDLIKEFSGFIARFLPDNERFISVNKNKNVFIREVNTGNNIYNLKGAVLKVNCIDLDNNSINVGSGFSDKYVNIWNIRSANIQKELRGYKNDVYSVKYIPEKNRIITLEHSNLCEFCDRDGFIKLWDLNSDSIVAVKRHIAEDLYLSKSGEEIVSFNWDAIYSNFKRFTIYDKNSLNPIGEFHIPDNIDFVFDTTSEKVDHNSYDKINKGVFLVQNLRAEYKLGDSLFTVYDSIGNVFRTILNGKGSIRALYSGPSSYSRPNFNSHFCLSNNGILTEWNMDFSRVLNVWDVPDYIKVEKRKPFIKFYQFSKYIVTIENQYKTIIWDAHTGKQLYTRLQLKGGDWLAYDEHYRFDGSPGGIDQLYLVCGLEVIDLNQVKDSLYVPGLVTQIMSGAKEIMMNDRPVPKLEDLQICELTPVVEPIDQDKTNPIRYRIIPRKGGLGNVELYINNNLTYTYKPSELKKETNTKNYILEVNTDTLQQYLIGDKGTKNPITIKPLIKGGGIYGRIGEGFTAVKTVDRKSPKFIGVFVGVNDYNNPAKDKDNPSYYTDLSYAEADAESMAQAMEQSARTLFDDSVLIYRVTQQSNKAPTKQELEKVFDDISKKAKSEDVLYIFFAGHGGVPKTQANPNNEVRFMLQKAQKQNPMSGSFGLSDIRQWTNAQRMKAQKRVLVFDACHSGQFIKDQMKLAYRGQKDEAWKKKQLDKLKDQSGMMILAASADDQSSYEDDQLKHGVMTYHLLKQIKETQQDTLLILNNWFGKSSEGVKFYIDRKYPRSGNDEDSRVQDPQMFGRGDFGVGMVTQQVRDSIQLNKIKTLIGKIQFTDATNSIYSKEPKFKEILYDQIQQQLDGNRYEFDPKANFEGLGYTIHSGSMFWMNNSSVNTYTIRSKGEDIKQVTIPQFTTDDPNIIAQKIAESIIKEIQVLEN